MTISVCRSARSAGSRRLALAAVSMLTATTLSGCLFATSTTDATPKTTPIPTAAPTSSAPRTTTSAPKPSTTSKTVGLLRDLPLTTDADFDSLPVWSIEQDSAWTIVIFDQDGVNQFKHANGCQLTTQQNRLAGGTTSDKAETDAQIDAAEKEFKARAPEAIFKPTTEPLPLYLGMGKTNKIEFGALLVKYTNKDTKTTWGSIIAIRAMPKVGSRMIANLSCPSEVMSATMPTMERLHVIGS